MSYDVVRQPEATLEDGYWVANMRAGVSDLNDTWSVYLWGKNITDERYRTQVLTSSIGFVESYGQPSSYGVGFERNF